MTADIAKKRRFVLEISDEDLEQLCRKTGEVGLRPEEMLQSFISDLVNGIHSNGSDERMYAEQWFERCFMFPEDTFLRYLLQEDMVDDVLKWQREIEAGEQQIKTSLEEIERGGATDRYGRFYSWSEIVDSEEKPVYASLEEWKKTEQEYMEQEQVGIELAKEGLNEIWDDFLAWTDEETHGSMEEEIDRLKEWKENCDRLREEEINGSRETEEYERGQQEEGQNIKHAKKMR